MASFNFNSGIRDCVVGNINLSTDTFKMMLLSGTVLAETEKDTFFKRSQVTTEATGTGYTAGGNAVTLTVEAVASVASDNALDITASAVSWPSSTITATGAVIYKARGGAATADELLCYIDFGGGVSSTAGTFTVTPSGSIKFQN